MNLHKWLQGNRDPVVQNPVIVQDVPPAEVPDKKVEAETVQVRMQFFQEVLRLGKRSAELRSALSGSALLEIGGHRNAKNHHQ